MADTTPSLAGHNPVFRTPLEPGADFDVTLTEPGDFPYFVASDPRFSGCVVVLPTSDLSQPVLLEASGKWTAKGCKQWQY